MGTILAVNINDLSGDKNICNRSMIIIPIKLAYAFTKNTETPFGSTFDNV